MGWFPFTWKRLNAVRPADRARAAASGARTSSASVTPSYQTNPDPTNNSASAAERRPGVATDFLPKPHRKAAPHVTSLVVPIVGQQRSGIFPSLVPVSNTPHSSPFRRRAASKEDALS
jgi:hypothetical protein